MAELTNLEEKLAEVTGLAMAAQVAGQKVERLTRDENDDLAQTLQRMAKEAAETQQRCEELAGSFEGKKTAILDEAREVKQKATEMMDTYLDESADALDGFEFLTMAEAAEVGHWAVLEQLNSRASNRQLAEVIDWVKPIQERHFQEALGGARTLAAEEDPDATE
jgi:flagellar hook-basal body complex protein FliE